MKAKKSFTMTCKGLTPMASQFLGNWDIHYVDSSKAQCIDDKMYAVAGIEPAFEAPEGKFHKVNPPADLSRIAQ